MSTDKQIQSKKPEDQSNAEWLADNGRVIGAANTQPDIHSIDTQNVLTGEFVYQGHRTTKRGRVVLEFMHKETGQLVAKFFNVELKNYRTGQHGQFTTKPRHKFRQFWMYLISKPPRRWSRVHTEMHKLAGLRFRGRATCKITKNGAYWNLEQVRKL